MLYFRDSRADSRPHAVGRLRRATSAAGGRAMSDADQPARDEQVPRGRVADLCAAMLRIGASLDLDTSCRRSSTAPAPDRGPLRRHRHRRRGRPATGHLHLRHDAGQRDALAAAPDGAKLFERLHDLPAPVRIPRYPHYARSLGHATPAGLLDADTVLGLPMYHRGAHVGSFFAAARGAEQLSASDQEVLELFAPQAAAAVANARTHRRERRARTYLEALVETSARRRRGVRRRHRGPDVGESRGEPHRRRLVRAGAAAGTDPRHHHLPPRRRARDRPLRVSDHGAARPRRDGARGGNDAVHPGRPQRLDPG